MGLKRASMEKYMHRSQAVLEELYPGEVVHQGTTYQVASSPVRRAAQYEPGGEMRGTDVVLRLARESQAQPWAIGTRLTYTDRDTSTSVEVRVTEQTSDEGAWVYRCKSPEEA